VSDEITVITVTRGRTALLERAIASVEAQELAQPPRHLVLVDDCAETATWLAARRPPLVAWRVCRREPGEAGGVARLARLRNLALGLLSGSTAGSTFWVAFLDDDNAYAPEHLRSLLACARRTGCRAVHSWRVLEAPDGSPYLAERFPWTRATDDPESVYAEFVRRGVLTPGSAVMRDRADPLDYPDAICTVDANEWLIEAGLLRAIGFHERYDAAEITQQRFDDGKLLLDLLRRGEPIACSERATVRYRLGGFSNAPGIAPPA
jgi:glycosyltransferase involved in cell wall biosynthesis